MKICTKCKETYPQEQFSKGKLHCKKCAAAAYKKYWHDTSKKHVNELPQEKTCSVCSKILPITEFYIRKDRNLPISRCKTCNHIASKKSYTKLTLDERNKKVADNKHWRDDQIKRGNLKVFFTQKLCSYKSTAKTHNLPFDLTTDYLIELFIKQQRMCYYTDKELTLVSFRGDGKRVVNLPNYHYQASLDKLEPKKGYVKGNVVWCGWLVNTCKNLMNENEFYELCKTVVNKKRMRNED